MTKDAHLLQRAVQPNAGRRRGMPHKLTLLTILKGGQPRLAVKTDKGILDIESASAALRLYAPISVDELLQNEDGPSLNEVVDAALSSAAAKDCFLSEDKIQYGPVVNHPEKIICVGVNYKEHAEEMGRALPKVPVLFNKFNTALNSHNGTIKLPTEAANNFDYEVELVVIVGKEAKNISEADGLKYVAGYATGNDFTARDLQRDTGGQWMIGKTPDGFGPLGPYLVTADQIDPSNLKIECRVNGETRQSSNTCNLIFNVPFLISYISKVITLRPGDVIFTGTPPGVIQGMPPEKQVWLKSGDELTCSVEKLGELRFKLA